MNFLDSELPVKQMQNIYFLDVFFLIFSCAFMEKGINTQRVVSKNKFCKKLLLLGGTLYSIAVYSSWTTIWKFAQRRKNFMFFSNFLVKKIFNNCFVWINGYSFQYSSGEWFYLWLGHWSTAVYTILKGCLHGREQLRLF